MSIPEPPEQDYDEGPGDWFWTSLREADDYRDGDQDAGPQEAGQEQEADEPEELFWANVTADYRDGETRVSQPAAFGQVSGELLAAQEQRTLYWMNLVQHQAEGLRSLLAENTALRQAAADSRARTGRVEAVLASWRNLLDTQSAVMTTAQANAYRSCVAELDAALANRLAEFDYLYPDRVATDTVPGEGEDG